MDAEEKFQADVIRRIYGILAAITALGFGWLVRDLSWAASFFMGAAASAINFRWFHRMVYSIGPGADVPPRRLAIFLTIRFMMLFVGAYVIVKFFGVRVTGLLAGFLVAGAAVMAEILYELIYARA
jgi:hypothetical protein